MEVAVGAFTRRTEAMSFAANEARMWHQEVEVPLCDVLAGRGPRGVWVHLRVYDEVASSHTYRRRYRRHLTAWLRQTSFTTHCSCVLRSHAAVSPRRLLCPCLALQWVCFGVRRPLAWSPAWYSGSSPAVLQSQ